MKRETFVNLFLENFKADEFIVNNLYGVLDQLDPNASYDDLVNIFETSVEFDQTFDLRAHKTEKATRNIRKLSPRETYIALIKGYCASVVLMLPRVFQNGGLGVTPIFIITSAVISTYCVGKLVDTGLAKQLYSYSLIVERAFGKKGRFILDFMIALTQFSFTIAGIIFIVSSFKITVDTLFSVDSNPWIYGGVIVLIYTPISWVRNIAKFSFTFMLGNILILMAVLFVSVYCCMVLARQDGIAEGVKLINENEYLTAVGMSVYCFEGIGIVMPVMHSSEDPQTFKSMLYAAIATLTTIYVLFGALGYMAWGNTYIEPYSTDMLPASNIAVIIMKFLFSFNLIFSYSITIQPANQIYGNWFCSCAPKGKCRHWMKNLQRTIVVLCSVIISLTIADKIDKFLSLVGAVLCAPLAMTIPALVHLSLQAKTTKEKLVDILLIAGSCIVLLFCTI